eukprot:2273442-Lingulodinium_polyedra.AAC.1
MIACIALIACTARLGCRSGVAWALLGCCLGAARVLLGRCSGAAWVLRATENKPSMPLVSLMQSTHQCNYMQPMQ